MKYVASKDQKAFVKELKEVYTAPTEEAALLVLDRLEESWRKKYAYSIKIWRSKWPNASTFFKYPQEIRTVIYTTNAVEAVHRQFRKVTKSISIFPNDDALRKMLFLAYRDLSKKWTTQIKNWPLVLSHLSIIFEERFNNVL